jgi:hypothetical protein
MAFDSTTSGQSANSYISVAEADEILSQRVGVGTVWSDLSPEEKQAALITATRRLEQEEYEGSKTTYAQALQFPRYEVYDRDQIVYASDAIPQPLNLACAELALLLIRDPELLDDTGLEQFNSLTVDKLSLSKDDSFHAGQLPANVRRTINHLLCGNGINFELIRG